MKIYILIARRGDNCITFVSTKKCEIIHDDHPHSNDEGPWVLCFNHIDEECFPLILPQFNHPSKPIRRIYPRFDVNIAASAFIQSLSSTPSHWAPSMPRIQIGKEVLFSSRETSHYFRDQQRRDQTQLQGTRRTVFCSDLSYSQTRDIVKYGSHPNHLISLRSKTVFFDFRSEGYALASRIQDDNNDQTRGLSQSTAAMFAHILTSVTCGDVLNLDCSIQHNISEVSDRYNSLVEKVHPANEHHSAAHVTFWRLMHAYRKLRLVASSINTDTLTPDHLQLDCPVRGWSQEFVSRLSNPNAGVLMPTDGFPIMLTAMNDYRRADLRLKCPFNTHIDIYQKSDNINDENKHEMLHHIVSEIESNWAMPFNEWIKEENRHQSIRCIRSQQVEILRFNDKWNPINETLNNSSVEDDAHKYDDTTTNKYNNVSGINLEVRRVSEWVTNNGDAAVTEKQEVDLTSAHLLTALHGWAAERRIQPINTQETRQSRQSSESDKVDKPANMMAHFLAVGVNFVASLPPTPRGDWRPEEEKSSSSSSSNRVYSFNSSSSNPDEEPTPPLYRPRMQSSSHSHTHASSPTHVSHSHSQTRSTAATASMRNSRTDRHDKRGGRDSGAAENVRRERGEGEVRRERRERDETGKRDDERGERGGRGQRDERGERDERGQRGEKGQKSVTSEGRDRQRHIAKDRCEKRSFRMGKQ
eukprot:GHVN01083692.1.p1 GENE.GHVN01083692.1~~GHVN01083692.1.p1  ORF type:complete len:698 (-),score=137.62 GHVN01083692.1:70-2163(-)